MRAVIQRVSEASVTIDGQMHGKIDQGMMILIGICPDDGPDDIQWMARKIIQMRIFSDMAGKMNRTLADVDGQILLISQFTLYASTKKGNRPSFIRAAGPEKAIPVYEQLIEELNKSGIAIKTGIFGAEMSVALVNDGPVTIILDSHQKE